MTEQPTIEPAPVAVDSCGSERLQQLHALYPELRARADAAAKELKAVTDAIKVELTTAHPDSRRLTLTGAGGPPLALTYSERWTVDSRKLKAEAPETYVRYAKKSGAWSLRVAQGGEE